MSKKFDGLVGRLVQKINMSRTKVPGFIVGLSGTDSIISFILLYKAMQQHNLEHRIYGIHYVNPKRKKPTWFERDMVDWLRTEYPAARIEVTSPLGAYQDPQMWADMHLRALNDVSYIDDELRITSLPENENYWVAGTMNATERLLGTYSIITKSVSIQPIQSLYKHEIIELCEEFNVPNIAIEMSKTPDCFCGRAEIAASNIGLIDDIVSFKLDIDKHDPEILKEAHAYVRETKADNEFKFRTPFTI